MFNLIVAGEAYEFFKVEEGVEMFPVSRLFESTSENIRNKLLPLSSVSLDYLANLPVLFITEPELDNKDKDEYSLIRIGKISNLEIKDHKKDKYIKFDFKIINDLNNRRLFPESSYSRNLQLGGFGLRRTHWSVKTFSISDALRMLGQGLNSLRIPSVNVAPPDRSDEQEIISEVDMYLNQVLSHSFEDNEEVFYRGHSDFRYELTPSLYRKNVAGNFRYRQNESEMITEILTVQPAEFMSDRYMLDKLVRMQHYGLPTRLLDITTNPLIALYFACSSVKSENGAEVDGSVIIMTTSKNQVKFFDSDTVSCIANLSRLTEIQKTMLDFDLDKDAFNKSDACEQLLHLIKDEKSHFKHIIDPIDLKRIIVVKGRMTNPRINSQSGAFLMFGEDAVLPDTDYSTLKIKKIRIRNKKGIMAQLARLGINESTVYPGIEKAAGEIAKKYDKFRE